MLSDISTLLDIGIALSKEKDIDKLLETILDATVDITDCDGGTLYVAEGDMLHFKLLVNKSLGLRQGFGGLAVDWPSIPLSGSNDCARAAVNKSPINVANVYADDRQDYSGTKDHDKIIRYKTVSMLTVPMENDYGDVVSVMQLLNAKDEAGRTVAFSAERERIALSLASQAAISITNRQHADAVAGLLDSFVRVMSTAIDARSQYNANHTHTMVRYAERFSTWLDNTGEIPFSSRRRQQLLMSVWLHDIGKLVVPLEIMDKETRLGSKINSIRNRFLLFEMQNKIDQLTHAINDDAYAQRAAEINDARAMVEKANVAGFLSDMDLRELVELAQSSACGPDGATCFLTSEELACLQVRTGTLTDEERHIMEGHVTMTRKLLAQMDFPKHFSLVPEWASSHHEFLDGTGYPDGVSADGIPLEARILTILDIYDALTASDRPYKSGMSADKAFLVLDEMAGQGKLDLELLRLFKKSDAWREDGRC